ncbi:DUF4158 domain-containing protein [Streptosporangium sp. NPDC050280]|uniref:DUF4158 domain-containing protein n=1 Tax=unclassified Streptosporangium TaxID=2632669 RepID=UPI00342EE256
MLDWLESFHQLTGRRHRGGARAATGATGVTHRHARPLRDRAIVHTMLGTFLSDPTDAPAVVVDYVAEQLGLDPADLKGYGEKEARWDHQKLIRQAHGYTSFEFEQWFGLARWVYRRVWSGSERPIVLFDLVTHRLVEAKILLPGVTTLEEMDVAAIHAAADVVADIAREPDEHLHEELTERYATVRRFLPKLLKHLDFDAGAALDAPGQGVRPGHEVLEAIDFLRAIERRRTDISPEEVPAAFLTSAWHRRVFPKRGEFAGTFDKQAYTLAAVERLRESLRRHEVFVPGLRKWGDPTAGLLTGAAWEKERPKICEELGLSPDPEHDVQRWATTLDHAYKQLAAGLSGDEDGQNKWVRLERDESGKDRLVLTGLERLDEPASLTALRADIDARIPVVDLPEALLEVHAWTAAWTTSPTSRGTRPPAKRT